MKNCNALTLDLNGVVTVTTNLFSLLGNHVDDEIMELVERVEMFLIDQSQHITFSQARKFLSLRHSPLSLQGRGMLVKVLLGSQNTGFWRTHMLRETLAILATANIGITFTFSIQFQSLSTHFIAFIFTHSSLHLHHVLHSSGTIQTDLLTICYY